jgi:hypothetical protein
MQFAKGVDQLCCHGFVHNCNLAPALRAVSAVPSSLLSALLIGSALPVSICGVRALPDAFFEGI